VDWVPPRPDRTEGVMFVYDGGIAGKELEKQIHLDHGELRSWAWSTERQADSRLSDLLARRVSAARQALRDQATTYLENGYLRT
jgi:8-oxo-dGTP diphosphatase